VITKLFDYLTMFQLLKKQSNEELRQKIASSSMMPLMIK